MNLRCFYCQTPFTLGRAEILAALQRMDAENMNHYDAHCPRCRRANSVSRQRLEMFYPNWREAEVEQESAAPASVEEKTPPVPAIPVEAGSAAAPAHKPARKRAGAAKKATPKPAGKAKKPATTKAKTTKPKSKPAATSSAKGKPASKAKKTATKSRKK